MEYVLKKHGLQHAMFHEKRAIMPLVIKNWTLLITEHQLIVNCTPLALSHVDSAPAIDYAALSEALLFLVYNPENPFLKLGKAQELERPTAKYAHTSGRSCLSTRTAQSNYIFVNLGRKLI